MFRKGKSGETKSRSVIAWGWVYEQEVTASGHEVSFKADKNVSKLDCDDNCAPL